MTTTTTTRHESWLLLSYQHPTPQAWGGLVNAPPIDVQLRSLRCSAR